jgi:hypothetical protein
MPVNCPTAISERHLRKLLWRVPRARRRAAQLTLRPTFLLLGLANQAIRLVADRDEDLVGVLLGVLQKASAQTTPGEAFVERSMRSKSGTSSARMFPQTSRLGARCALRALRTNYRIYRRAEVLTPRDQIDGPRAADGRRPKKVRRTDPHFSPSFMRGSGRRLGSLLSGQACTYASARW